MQAIIKKSEFITLDDPMLPGHCYITAPPKGLYVVGNLPPGQPVAVVGSRKMTPYGRRVVAHLASRLAIAGVPVISGLAFGVDRTVHQAVLEAGGASIAVLPTGLNESDISPQAHLTLARRLATEGALLSEYPDGTRARKENYLARNRLISGLARSVVLVEAAVVSGSMTTARWALEQGKDIWAVPGPIDSTVSGGTNLLIRDGAHPLTSIPEFIESLGIVHQGNSQSQDPLVSYFTAVPIHIETVIAQSGLRAGELERAITKLELAGVIRHVGGRYYVRD